MESLVFTEWLMVVVFVSSLIIRGYKMRGSADTLEKAFLADRNVPGLIASLSTVAAQANANNFIGGAGAIYVVGVMMVHQNLVNSIALIIASLFLVRKLRRWNVFTLGQWLGERYTPAIGSAYSIIWSMVWMLFNMGLYIYAGALVLETLVGWNLYLSIILLAIIAAIYTLYGGFGAIVSTHVVAMGLMFFPFVVLAFLVWHSIGNLDELAKALPAAKASFWTSDTKLGSPSLMIFGMFFMGLSYWSTEATIIQRPLSAKDENQSSISFLGAAFWFTIIFPLAISIPALAAIVLFPDLPRPDMAMPMLIRRFVPPGLYGVIVVGLLAGVFSSIDSTINTFCSMFTSDVYKKLFRPAQLEAHYLKVSKIAGIIFTFFAIGTALLVSGAKNGMLLFALAVLGTIMPPFGGITLIGAFFPKRANKVGATIGLIAGGIVAIALFIADHMGVLSSIAENTLFFRAMVTFVVTALLTLIGSLFGKHVEIDTKNHREPKPISKEVITYTVLLIVTIICVYAFWFYYFR